LEAETASRKSLESDIKALEVEKARLENKVAELETRGDAKMERLGEEKREIEKALAESDAQIEVVRGERDALQRILEETAVTGDELESRAKQVRKFLRDCGRLRVMELCGIVECDEPWKLAILGLRDGDVVVVVG
jgi:predicted RNase H-like nuclease (RuvC/YqgF family)